VIQPTHRQTNGRTTSQPHSSTVKCFSKLHACSTIGANRHFLIALSHGRHQFTLPDHEYGVSAKGVSRHVQQVRPKSGTHKKAPQARECQTASAQNHPPTLPEPSLPDRLYRVYFDRLYRLPDHRWAGTRFYYLFSINEVAQAGACIIFYGDFGLKCFKRCLLKNKLKQTAIRDIAAQNCCLLMLFSFVLVTECCS